MQIREILTIDDNFHGCQFNYKTQKFTSSKQIYNYHTIF